MFSSRERCAQAGRIFPASGEKRRKNISPFPSAKVRLAICMVRLARLGPSVERRLSQILGGLYKRGDIVLTIPEGRGLVHLAIEAMFASASIDCFRTVKYMGGAGALQISGGG